VLNYAGVGDRLTDLDTNSIETIVSGTVGQNFQTDRFSGGFVFNQNQSVMLTKKALILIMTTYPKPGYGVSFQN
jgi:hypothetical protein